NPLITPAPMLHMGGQTFWQLLLVDTVGNQSLLLDDSFQEVYNPSGGASFLPGDDPNHDAGIRIDFLVDQKDFPLWFFNRTFDVYLANYTNVAYKVGEFAQENPHLSPVSLP